MYNYQPTLGHAILTAFIALTCLGLTSFAKGRWLTVLNVGFILFLIMTGLIWWMLLVNNNVEAAIRQDDSAARFAEAFAKLDDEGREVLAMRYPKMRFRMKQGEVRAFFESTKVPVGKFKLFLQTSNSEFISPERDWVTAEMPPHIWKEIFHWLETNNKIIPDSAAGSHSWRWNGNSYQQMVAYWMAGRHLVDMGKAERIAAAIDRNYAANDD